jgi:thiamine-monophosphate kinase
VLVTGTIGDAALGLRLRRDASAARRWRLGRPEERHLETRYLVPEPRGAIADVLREYASAAMDVSDGLAGDLGKLCRASGVAADIEIASIPLSDAARLAVANEPEQIETIMTGGDDFEILACVPADNVDALRRRAAAADVAVTEIGTVAAGEGQTRFRDRQGNMLVFARPSFSHF